MHHVRRSAALTLLFLLAVTFGPLLCRIGGDQAWLAGRAATAAATPATDASTVADANAPADATAAVDTTRPAVATVPKRCSDRHAPGPDESAPLPAPHRGEPLAPTITGPGPLAADLPAQFALARPPTGTAPAVDHTALLPVLRI
ncbi:hypothetical protein [Streptomyces inhibens]|uniref:hypothetical protein n=1 Tax=Streptomyces inhibens TaxID=2293571 RepID=UPI001EE6E13A|nr:hypothetical protein [Streptomyces inhibens]UKY52774.1 hypothetical protein KI385_30895 [Streptomyces inhibens]